MKRTLNQTEYRRASADVSHRTMKEIQKGPPARKPAPPTPSVYLEKPRPLLGAGLTPRELEEAKRLAAKYLPQV